MAKKKVYAVRKGHKTGLFYTWADCQKATAGYSGAEFKSFATKEEAMGFLENKVWNNPDIDALNTEEKKAETVTEDGVPKIQVPENTVIAYVDGSFQAALGRYSYGCVMLTSDGRVTRESGSGNNPDAAAIRNVAGEMLGAMTAVKWAMKEGCHAIELRYDYEGIEKWVTGVWKAKTPLTQKYAAYMQKCAAAIRISFRKVAAHTGDYYNEEADQLAKAALTNE